MLRIPVKSRLDRTFCGQMVDQSRDDLLWGLFVMHKEADKQEARIKELEAALEGRRIDKISNAFNSSNVNWKQEPSGEGFFYW